MGHEIHFFYNNYIVDNCLLGTFGDFIGGVLGTVFALISILIMIRTFNKQMKSYLLIYNCLAFYGKKFGYYINIIQIK